MRDKPKTRIKKQIFWSQYIYSQHFKILILVNNNLKSLKNISTQMKISNIDRIIKKFKTIHLLKMINRAYDTVETGVS